MTRTDIEQGKQNVPVPDEELTVGVTHRRRPVAASARLMKHQRAVPILQPMQQLRGGLGDQRAGGPVELVQTFRRFGLHKLSFGVHQKKPCALFE